MITHYIYALHHKNKPFYIGISIEPVKRLHDHFGAAACPGIGSFVRKIKSISEVSIIILDTIRTKSVRKCKVCVLREQQWIDKYLKQGHKLVNVLLKNI